MKRCVKCVLPESFPGLEFNTDGVCSLCTEFETQDEFIPSLENLTLKFHEIVEESKRTTNQYDALVAYSGGKDSTYLIYILQKEFDLKLLAVTLDNGFITPQSFENIRMIVDNLGVDHIVFKPGFDIARKIFVTSANDKIYPTSLLKVGSSVCISCIRIVTNISLRIAIEKRIPMIMLGNSPGQLIRSEREIIYKDNKIPFELKRGLFKPLADRIGDDIYYYLTLDKDDYSAQPFPYTISPLPLIGYDENTVYETIKKLGWKKPDDMDACSTNCQLNSYGIIKHIERMKFHPYDYELSTLVRLGIITRDEAIDRLERSTATATELSKAVEKRLLE